MGLERETGPLPFQSSSSTSDPDEGTALRINREQRKKRIIFVHFTLKTITDDSSTSESWSTCKVPEDKCRRSLGLRE